MNSQFDEENQGGVIGEAKNSVHIGGGVRIGSRIVVF